VPHIANLLASSQAYTETRVFEDLLEKERQKSTSLSQHVSQLQMDVEEATNRARASQTKEKELTERCREQVCPNPRRSGSGYPNDRQSQERQLQLTTASVNELKLEVEQHERRVRDLEEQIQSDDRVEQLENSLKNTQDRADELEFQLTKLKQVGRTLLPIKSS